MLPLAGLPGLAVKTPTVKRLLSATVKAPLNKEAPWTVKVEDGVVVLMPTRPAGVILNTEAPVEEANSAIKLLPPSPTTENLAAGEVVPTPTLPALASATNAYLPVIVPAPVGAAMYWPYHEVIVPVEKVKPW